MDIPTKIRSALVKVEHKLDHVILTLKKKLNLIDKVDIYPYIGYCNKDVLYLKGRVKECQRIRNYKPDNIFENTIIFFRRYLTNEIPGVQVKGSIDGMEVYTKTDEEGFFELEIKGVSRRLCGQLDTLEVELLDTFKNRSPVRKQAEVLMVNNNAEFGVISDIDDTIINTYSGSFWKSFKVMVLNDARSRTPFKGVADFYQLLQKGKGGNCRNPLFYVSGSSWNLYDLIIKFCEEHGIPKGPFFLRDRGLTKHYTFSPGHFEYKPQNIEKILDFYPKLSFLLIGDSGQKDAEIYKHLAEKYPERIRGIIIRDVTKPKRDKEVHEIARKVEKAGIPMALVSTTDEAVDFSRRIGLIE